MISLHANRLLINHSTIKTLYCRLQTYSHSATVGLDISVFNCTQVKQW